MTSFLRGKRILVTGASGFLGRHVCRHLLSYQPETIEQPRSSDCDLRRYYKVRELLDQSSPHVVIHLAAVCGGIGLNQREPGSLFYDNALMGLTLMEAAREAGVDKFISVASVCSYPKHTTPPFRESDLWNGYPEETNAAYGLAKKMLLVQAQAYRQQYGFNAVTLLPSNLYGPGDRFEPETSHVIPAIIRKVVEAKEAGRESVTLWGSGSATRDFLYVEDCADGLCRAADQCDDGEPVNVGSGVETSIAELAEMVCKLCKYDGKILWDTSKPDGQPRRCLDTRRAREAFCWHARTPLAVGLERTVKWWEEERCRSVPAQSAASP